MSKHQRPVGVQFSRLACALIAAGIVCVAAAPARTQTPPEDYFSLIALGLAAFKADEKWEARAYFERAHALVPSARTLRVLGLTDLALDRYSLAKRELEAALKDSRKPLDPAQVRDVNEQLAWMASSLAIVGLRCTPPHAQARIDGDLQDTSEVVLKPGQHELQVSADGFVQQQQSFDVHHAQTIVLTIALTPAQPPANTRVAIAVERAPHSAPVAMTPPSPPPQDSTTWPWMVGGIGLGAMIAGGTLFGLGMADLSNVENSQLGVRLSEIEPAHDRAPWLTGTGIALGIAGIACVTTAAIGLTAGRKREATAWSIDGTPLGVELAGRF